VSHDLVPGSRSGLSGLERYAEQFNAVEVNSTFYRLPLGKTVERWRDSTPPAFRFAVKLPRSITHEAGLIAAEALTSEFCERVSRFEPKLGPLLVQLPPRLELDVSVASRFLEHLIRVAPAHVVLEPRHVSWFTADAERLLVDYGVARVAADPPCCAAAALPAAAARPCYFRWHGSPRKYFSAYPPEAIATLAAHILALKRSRGARSEVYCFFDNTALGAAPVNALSLEAALVAAPQRLSAPASPAPSPSAPSPSTSSPSTPSLYAPRLSTPRKASD
jgi:uncharacterized protein YecE (DUF72 family)